LGDSLYASAEGQARADRLLLHACELSVPHPVSGAVMSFVNAPPF
jgi:tRNA pseudouridine32 synthase/23S rRNA pseudouridine746 synthase